jgi:6-phosphogluconate dehydrogenase
MVHNGMEYGIMQAYAEGFDILKGASQEVHPGKPALQAEPRRSRRSLAARQRHRVLAARPDRDRAGRGRVALGVLRLCQDSGEGRWTIEAAIEEAVPADVLTAALYTRFRSRQDHTYAEKILSAMRKQFGGHQEPHEARKRAPLRRFLLTRGRTMAEQGGRASAGARRRRARW